MTLTAEQIHAYEKYDGDIDGWTRSRESKEHSSSGENWHVIDDLLTRLEIRANGIASGRFLVELDQAIASAAPDERVRNALLALAERSISKRKKGGTHAEER